MVNRVNVYISPDALNEPYFSGVLPRTLLGACIGSVAGFGQALVTLAATSMAYMWLYPYLNPPFHRYGAWYTIAAIHGAICGSILANLKRKPVLGGIAGWFVAVILLGVIAAILTAIAMIGTFRNDPEHFGIVPAMSLFLPLVFFYGLGVFLILAIPIFVHGTIIDLFTYAIIRRTSLANKYK